MNAFYIILAVCSVLLLGAVAFLMFIVIGIHMGDRGGLGSPASNCIDAMTRRVAGVGIRKTPATQKVKTSAENPSCNY